MSTNIKTSIVIGILLGTMLFPMIMIPLMGIGVLVGTIYMLIHEFIMPRLHHHEHPH